MALVERAETYSAELDGGPRREAMVLVLEARGVVRRTDGDLEGSDRDLRAALGLAEEAYGPASAEVAWILNDVGMTAKYAGRFEEGEVAYRRSVAILEEIGGSEHPDLGPLFHNLGGLAHARRDFAAAEPLARRGLELSERLRGADHPITVRDRVAYAAILDGLGRSDEAEAMFRDGIGCRQASALITASSR
jgi:hypothetical protein